MLARRRREDLAPGTVGVLHEERVARRRRVVGEPAPVMRPVQASSATPSRKRRAEPPRVGTAHTLIASSEGAPERRTHRYTSVASAENPSVRRDGFTSSPITPPVRLWNWPVPTWLTQTSVAPSRSERKATKLPSRDSAAACSAPSKSVRGVNRAAARGFRSASVPSRSHRKPARAAKTAPARASHATRRCGRPASAAVSGAAAAAGGRALRAVDHASSAGTRRPTRACREGAGARAFPRASPSAAPCSRRA